MQGAGLVTVFQPVQVNIPTVLTATPRVNGDGTITMYIPFQLSQQTGESVGPNGERAPNTFTSQIAVLRRVPNGGTVVLGGVLTKNDTETPTASRCCRSCPSSGDVPIQADEQERQRDADLLHADDHSGYHDGRQRSLSLVWRWTRDEG